MKNLLFILLVFPFFVTAQGNCPGEDVTQLFHSNQIGATFSPQGNKFFTGNGFFKIPYTSTKSPGTIYSSNPWVSGYLNGELKVAAQRYPWGPKAEYYAGPLLENATILDSACIDFNKIWEVNRQDIERHIADFEDDGIIEDSVNVVFSWPAEGNEFFNSFNGFALPSLHHGGWAHFSDTNQNGKYEPQLGEYPNVILNEKEYVPENIIWMVFNDQGPHIESEGSPLGIEIQLTVFALSCQNNAFLNNALFCTNKLINQNGIKLDSVYFGNWTDYDLGCSENDCMGCDTTRNTEYCYNKSPVDGSQGEECYNGGITYGSYPPIQSCTYLSHKMTGFVTAPFTFPLGYHPFEYNNFLKGRWRDGTPISIHGDGYNPGSNYETIHYLFPGDPRDTLQWSEINSGFPYGDPSTVSSVYLDSLAPYQTENIEMVYIFHQDSSLDYLQKVGFMQFQIDQLLEMIENNSIDCIPFPFCSEPDCVWPGDFNHNGKADQFDLLYWGVTLDQQGANRNGPMEWEGYNADFWELNLPNDLNAKHGDGNGDGHINELDLERNLVHFSLVNPFYQEVNLYPPGPHVVVSADPIDETGSIHSFRISAGENIPNVLGLAYEIEFDTSLFEIQRLLTYISPDSNFLCLTESGYDEKDKFLEETSAYAFVMTNHLPVLIDSNSTFQRNFNAAFTLRPGLTINDIPDSTIIRLRNLIALDPDGHDLQIGSTSLVVYKDDMVGFHSPAKVGTMVYPNPSNGFINIDCDVPSEAQILTLQGQMIRHLSVDEIKDPVDVSTLPPGLYILKVLATGETLKLVVQ